MSDRLSFTIGGKRFEGWENISIKRSIDTLCGKFTVALTDRWTVENRAWQIREQDPALIEIGNTPVLTGRVDAVNASIGPSGHSLELEGRDLTADLVDCSVVQAPGTWNNVKFFNFINALAGPFGINVAINTEISSDKFNFTIDSGVKIYEVLQRLAQKEGVLLQTDPYGNLSVENNQAERGDTGLAMGDNIKSASCSFDTRERFSRYIVRGQDAGTGKAQWKKTAGQIQGEAQDAGILRSRPLLIQAETNATIKTAARRAQWEKTTRKARALGVSVVVEGWRQTGSDQLWTVNKIVNVYIPQFEIQNLDLLIAGVEFTKDTNGTQTKLDLVPEDTFLVKPTPPAKKKKVKSKGGSRWLA